ncbi:lysine transporter LysE [Amycolatopsis antarctica]|uniref:Lysine transporter LysE n=1 Tax=Amycolatopsis antarctica TaxID=1854586 RepID=A0A263D5G4_9PSEU|nr:LysE family translocator [Amycolatopsis antarctica]OZM72837.1 lysine transporter LysE [Amycolatopsis antarctica]
MSWLWAFLGLVVVAYVVPGPDWVVILRQSVRDRRAGLVAAAGVQCGLCVHLAAASLGVSALLLRSALAFTILKIAGAAYLIFLGAQALWRSRRNAEPYSEEPAADGPLTRIFGQALVSNVLNPKAALFFVSLLPQFVDPAAAVAPQVLLLGGIDVAVGIVWWVLFVALTGRLSGFMRRAKARRMLDRVTGTALVGLGAGVAATAR